MTRRPRIGDRIIMTQDQDMAKEGMTGTMVVDRVYGYIGVEFDKPMLGHNLEGHCEYGRGYWLFYPDRYRVITHDPNSLEGQIYEYTDKELGR